MDKKLAQFILSQRHFLFNPAYPAGPKFATFRAMVIARLSGCKKMAVPIAKAGVNVYMKTLAEALGVDMSKLSFAAVEREIKEKLEQIANA
jgi:hypothetical protein